MIKGDEFKDADFVRQPAGSIILDGHETASTVQCVHCGAHWVPRRGSGIIRGFCRKCMGPICGPRCIECLPFEKWLDKVERIG